MNRRQFRFIVLSCAALLLVALGVLVLRNFKEQQLAALQQLALRLVSEADQRIQNFHRISIRDGRKVWEISAREARYFEDKGIEIR